MNFSESFKQLYLKIRVARLKWWWMWRWNVDNHFPLVFCHAFYWKSLKNRYYALRENVQVLSDFWSVFSVFGLNKEIYSVNLFSQSEYRNIRTRNHSVFGHFSRIAGLPERSMIYWSYWEILKLFLRTTHRACMLFKLGLHNEHFLY